MNRVVERALEQPITYRLWQATHAKQKFAPILSHNDMSRVRRVLDVGCGPGTNARLFSHCDYLGIDINPKYIATARRRFGRRFEVADATTFVAPEGERFDFILVNSLLHHIDLIGVRRILSHLATLLTDGGHLHSIEVVMPEQACLERTMARWDRGRFCRSIREWREVFTAYFDAVVFEVFPVNLMGRPFWQMVYFKGRAKQ